MDFAKSSLNEKYCKIWENVIIFVEPKLLRMEEKEYSSVNSAYPPLSHQQNAKYGNTECEKELNLNKTVSTVITIIHRVQAH